MLFSVVVFVRGCLGCLGGFRCLGCAFIIIINMVITWKLCLRNLGLLINVSCYVDGAVCFYVGLVVGCLLDSD